MKKFFRNSLAYILAALILLAVFGFTFILCYDISALLCLIVQAPFLPGIFWVDLSYALLFTIIFAVEEM